MSANIDYNNRSILPYHVYCTPYETDDEKRAAEFILYCKYIEAQQEEQCGGPKGELQVLKEDQNSGIDWFIYREHILNLQLFLFAIGNMRQRLE